jgi:TolB-like protein/Tfp pilus assembly protein PilF
MVAVMTASESVNRGVLVISCCQSRFTASSRRRFAVVWRKHAVLTDFFRGSVPLASPHLSLLGTLSVEFAAPEVGAAIVGQPKRFALLAYLALARPRGWQRRDAIVAMFWPESTQERARRALRDAIYVLRRELGEGVIEGRGSEEVRLAPAMRVDAHAFEELLATGDLAGALDWYRGDLLSAFHLNDLPEFGQWIDQERDRLRRLALQAARTLRDQRGVVDPSVALAIAERAVELSEGDATDRTALARIVADIALQSPTRPGATSSARPDTRVEPVAPVEAVGDRPSAAPAPSPHRRWLAFAAAATAGALLLAVVWTRPAPTPTDPRSALVLPFTVHGGPAVQYLGDGMMDLLTAKLDGVGGVHVVDPQSVHAALLVPTDGAPDLGTARTLAARFGSSSFVMGSVVEVGGRLQISAYLYGADGQELARAEGIAPLAELLSVVDDIARELLVGFLTGPEAELAQGAALSTESLPALRAYLDGERAMREGDFATAHDAYASATVLDSTFALAFYRLSSAADWLGRAEDAHAALRNAVRHRERLTGTDRLLVDARADFWLGDAAEAERRYRRLVTLRPTSVEGWYELAEVHFHGGPWMGRDMREAMPYFREVLRLMPTHASGMLHLARLAALQGDVVLVDSLTAVLAAQEPGHARLAELHLLGSGLRVGADRLPPARAALDAVDVTSRAMAVDRMAVYTGDRAGALALALPLTAAEVPEFPRRAGLEISAHLAAGLGRWATADSMLDRLAEVDPLRAAQARALAVLGAAAPSDTARARGALATLRAAPATRMLSRTDPDLRVFAALREPFYLGALSLRVGADEPVIAALQALDAAAQRTDLDGTYARHLAGLLRALAAQQRGDPVEALRVLEASWPGPRRELMVRWAWNHTVVLARVVRAELLDQLDRTEEAHRWAAAAVEDIAGTPLLQGRIDRVLGR